MRRPAKRSASKSYILALTLLVSGASRGAAQTSIIERAQPDAARQARSAAWLEGFGSQRPALLLAITELERERNRWSASSNAARCRTAQRALGEVDRDSLLAVADYRLVSAVGAALDSLDRAVRACQRRRYFELDYRLGVARQSFDQARRLALAQVRR